jgi:hypothetical protein
MSGSNSAYTADCRALGFQLLRVPTGVTNDFTNAGRGFDLVSNVSEVGVMDRRN